MTITFYITNSKENDVNKELKEIITLTGKLKDDTSILSPVIEIKRNDNIILSNYIYIPIFNRYYFITDISVNNNFFNISCKVDVLMTYKDNIISSTQVISRQENNFNLFLEDDSIPVKSYKTLTIKQINKTTPFQINANDYINNNNYYYLLNVSNLEG